MAKLQKTTQLWVLVVVVLLDLLAVSLVVPLLPARYRELGVGAKALGFASSAYSLAQIVGGLALGALSDRSLGPRGLVVLSFFWVCGGIYGAEEILAAAPPAYVFAAMVFTPVLFGLPAALMNAELSTAFPVTGENFMPVFITRF